MESIFRNSRTQHSLDNILTNVVRCLRNEILELSTTIDEELNEFNATDFTLLIRQVYEFTNYIAVGLWTAIPQISCTVIKHLHYDESKSVLFLGNLNIFELSFQPVNILFVVPTFLGLCENLFEFIWLVMASEEFMQILHVFFFFKECYVLEQNSPKWLPVMMRPFPCILSQSNQLLQMQEPQSVSDISTFVGLKLVFYKCIEGSPASLYLLLLQDFDIKYHHPSVIFFAI